MRTPTFLLAMINVPAFAQQLVSIKCSGNVAAMSQSNNGALD